MTKISARGATELARRKTPNGTYVLRSDGRILWKSSVPGDHFKIVGRIKSDPARFVTIFSGRIWTSTDPLVNTLVEVA